MALFDIYSKRQKKAQGAAPDVFVYDKFPQSLRTQIVHIWMDAFGQVGAFGNKPERLFKQINDILCREYGVFQLTDDRMDTPWEAVSAFLLSAREPEKVLDVIELSFRFIEAFTTDYQYRSYASPKISPEEAIAELNARFLEHGVGYQYESRHIVRKDSEILHSEAVKPALVFLSGPMYKGANEEFLNAHKHYRGGQYKECLNECLKALESVLKAICDKRKWKYDTGATANALLDVCFRNTLVPVYLQSHFNSLRNTLESGVPTLRNKTSGHGQGSQPVSIPPYYAGYALHLTASAILLLVQAERDLP